MPSIARCAAALFFLALGATPALVAADDAPVQPASTEMFRLDLSSRQPAAGTTLDLTREPADIWERMRLGFAMQDLSSDLVTEHQIAYLSRPSALRATLERGRKYLYHIVVELEKRGMPTELALLPVVESAYNPMANSPANASGLWQFIPSTGKDFNLTQNWWVDERRDVVASTNAALSYLQAVYEMQGDWQLALASYNWGENAVARAVARNRAAGLPTDFANLTMPAETRNYVPKLQALKNIIANPHLFGITLPDIPNTPYFEIVETRKSMDLTVAAKLANMSVKDFLELNPSFNRPVIPGRAERTLVLPRDRVRTFLTNMENQDIPLLNWKTYTTRSGERLEQIADRFGISVAKLREVNSLPPNSRPGPGYTLLVPAVERRLPEPAVANEPDNEPRIVRQIRTAPRHATTKADRHGRKITRAERSNHQPRLARAEKPRNGKVTAKILPPKKPASHRPRR